MVNGLESVLQIFPSSDIDAATRYYEGLGFRAVPYLGAAEPHVCLYRDSIEIILTKSKLASIVPTRETHGYGLDAYFISEDQAGLYRELRERGVKIVKGLDMTDYGNREFIFEDLERRWIAIGKKKA
jgi:hypothetical protein